MFVVVEEERGGSVGGAFWRSGRGENESGRGNEYRNKVPIGAERLRNVRESSKDGHVSSNAQ